MTDNRSLKEFYKEQLDLYPKISQEEIIKLYESEGITTETIDEALQKFAFFINKKKEELSSLTDENDKDRLLHAIFGENNPEQEKIMNLKSIIINLEKKAEELYILHQEMLELLPSTESADNSIEKTIEKLNQEIAHRKQEIEAGQIKQENLNVLKSERVNLLIVELEELEEKANKLKRTYKTYSHKFYISTRGIIPRDRKFPSNEVRNKIVCGTIGFARYWASVYYRKIDNQIPFDDLVQIASQALMSAAHYYIPSDRAKFTTYARRCIENKLKREVYNRKKLKRRPCKPEEFFQKEKDKIKYIQMFLEALKTKSKSGKTKYYSDKYVESISVMLFRFKEDIRTHNWEMRMREENYRLLPSYAGRGTQEKLDVITQRIVKMINDSKMKTLITDEDRELASLLVNYQNRPRDMQELYQFIYYLECYSYKLNLIERYFKVQEELTLKNNGVTPTDDEILEELNKKIKLDNQERFRLKKEGFFKRKPSYEEYYNYWSEYRDIYHVDPFINPETYEFIDDKDCYEDGMQILKNQTKYSSKKKERDDITSEFKEDERLYNLDSMIESIDYCESEKIVLYFADEDDSQIYGDWEEFTGDDAYENTDVFSKEEALERLRTIRETIPELTEEDYVKMILQQRKDKVNATLQEKNAPIVEQNRKITEQRDKYDLGQKYQRYLKDWHIAEVKKDIELLYSTDSELLLLLNTDKNKGRWNHANSLSVEEEVLNNLFLKDYYQALNQLPELERQVLLKYFDENGTHAVKAKEIGAELNISENKVYKVKSLALKRLSANQKLKSYNKEL